MTRLSIPSCFGALLIVATACAHSTGSPGPRAGGGETTPAVTELAEDAVRRASMPFTVHKGPEALKESEWLSLLDRATVVCVGERHDDPAHHNVQWQLIRRAAQLAVVRGVPFAVGFEMFQTPSQEALSRYGAGSLTEEDLLTQSQWKERWGYPFRYYRPQLMSARDYSATLLALNAPRELTKAIAGGGLTALTPPQRALLPELTLTDLNHRAFFERAMGMPLPPIQPSVPGEPGASPAAHPVGSSSDPKGAPPQGADASTLNQGSSPHGHMNLDNIYAAQVVWDERMATESAAWLKQHPRGRLVILAGSGHCHRHGIPSRLKRRGVEGVLSVRPVERSQLGKSDAPRDRDFDLLFVLEDQPARPRAPLPN